VARLYFPSDPGGLWRTGPGGLGPLPPGPPPFQTKAPASADGPGLSGELRLRVRQRRHVERPDVAYSGRMLSRSQRAAPHWRKALAQDRA